MKNKIYFPKEELDKLIKKYPAAENEIKKEIIKFEKKFNKDNSYAKFCEYKIFLNKIGETIFFKNKESNKWKYHLNIKIEKKYLDILEDKDLFNKITINELDKKIVKEIPARKTIFLCANGRLVKNSQISSYNLLVNDEAGTGKDYITSNTLDIFPKKDYIKKTRISPTVFTYWHNSKFEPEWTWDGKIFYTEDISEKVLNSEVFKVMCSSGSEATIVIKQMAIDIKIEGKPVIITTTANSTPNTELVRRFEILNLSEGINQTKEIMKRHCEYAKIGVSPTYNKDIIKAMENLQRVNVKIPFADNLYLLFPTESLMMRTKFPRFLDFIKASAAFHQFQRNWESSDTILAEKQDYEIACEVIKSVSSNKYLISLTKNQKKIVDFIEKNQNNSFSATEIRKGIKNILSLPSITTNLSQLASYGIIDIDIEQDRLNRDIEKFRLSDNIIKGVHTIIFPSFENIMKIDIKDIKDNKDNKDNKDS